MQARLCRAPIDIGAGDQFKPVFLEISPNNEMLAMVDHDGPDGKPISSTVRPRFVVILPITHPAAGGDENSSPAIKWQLHH